MYPTREQRDAIYALWDDLAGFPVAQTDAALIHLMKVLAGLVRAGNAFWIGALRVGPAQSGDPLKGWRPRINRYLFPAPIHEEAYKGQLSKWNRREIDPSFRLPMRNVGRFRSYRLRASLPAEWFRGGFYKLYYASRGIRDSCFVIFPLHEDCESCFAFQRVNTRSDFRDAEEVLLVHALRGIKWFHRQLVLSHGLTLACGPLTPLQRQIVHLLLTGSSESEIADQMEHSAKNVHKHITGLFRKFGVNSRAGLMALWLGRKD